MSRPAAGLGAAAVAITLALSGFAEARTPLFWGAGSKPCSAWNSQRGLQDRASAGLRGWVFGMISGYNIGRSASGAGDVMDGATQDELWAGIDEFCAAHPDEKIWLGVFAALQAFDARRPPAAAEPAVTPPTAEQPAPPP